jgi:lipopolysaccharide export LptBFGC system permease protein LptF
VTGRATRDEEVGHVPRWLKAVLWAVVIVAAVFVLFTWVFPWVEDRQQDPTIDASVEASHAAQVLRLPR